MILEYKIESIATIGTSVLLGTAVGGPIGGIVGLATSVLDEYLIAEEIEEKHYIAQFCFWESIFLKSTTVLTAAHPTYKWIFYASSVVSAFAISYFEEDFLDYKTRITTPLDAFLSLNKLFNLEEESKEKETNQLEDWIFGVLPKSLNNQFSRDFVKMSGLKILRIVIDHKFLQYIGTYGQGLFISNLLLLHGKENFKIILKEGGKVIGFFLVKESFDFLIQFTEMHLDQRQFQTISEKGTEIMLMGDNVQKLISSEKGKEIINNLDSDLFMLLWQGLFSFNRQITGILKIAMALSSILLIAPEAFIFYLLPFLLKQSVLRYVAVHSKIYQEELFLIQNKMYEIRVHMSNNAENVNLRDGKDYVKHKYDTNLEQKNFLDKCLKIMNVIQEFSSRITISIDQFMDVLYLGYKFVHEQISVQQIPILKKSFIDLSNFLSSGLAFRVDNTQYLLVKQRIDTFFSIISTSLNTSAVHTTNPQEKIILDKYSLMLDGNSLLKIDHLEFESGKHYAITGKSGCGKTSVLKDIYKGVFGHLSSSGEISLPKEARIMFVNQDAYMPPDSTLLEIIYFPRILQILTKEQIEGIRRKVILLFKELEIDSFINDDDDNPEGIITRLDSKDFKLSGGQTKKIAVIQVILNSPNILIADELITGLDKKSLIKVEHALMKYLPDTMMLFVDHYAEENNYDNFYDFEVHFNKEEGAIVRFIASKESNIETDTTHLIETEHNICWQYDWLMGKDVCSIENATLVF